MKEKKYVHVQTWKTHLMFIYVGDMKCWNNLEKDKIQLNSNDDMM